MKNKYIPENWALRLQDDCVGLVKRNLGIKINKSDVDVKSANFVNVFPLIVKAMDSKYLKGKG